jgi:hypothetical protein
MLNVTCFLSLGPFISFSQLEYIFIILAKEKTNNFIIYTGIILKRSIAEHCGGVLNTPALYLGGPGFISLLGDRLS